MSLNKCTLIGRVGKDPEIRSTQDGREIANFSLATTDHWKGKDGEKKERTEWHRVVCFNPNLTNIIKSYVKKGSQLYVEGSLQTRKWNKDGVDHYTTEVILQAYNGQIVLLGGKSESGKDNTEKDDYSEKPATNNYSDLDDSIPF